MNAPVDDLRSQLRSLGYLSSGVERWFALDPFRSTTFWRELAIVVMKTATLAAPFALAPIVAITSIRNPSMNAADALLIGAIWLLIVAFALAALLVALALALRSHAGLGVEHPRALTLIGSITAALPTLAIGWWWWGYETAPGGLELLMGAGLLVAFFVVASVAFAAALLSFTIFETGRIPVMRHTSSTGILAIAAAVLVALIAVPEALRSEPAAQAPAPSHVPVRATTNRIALLAVDGLTPDDARALSLEGLQRHQVAPAISTAPPERWATIATGVPEDLHGVHSIEGVRLSTSGRVLQEVSSVDFVVRTILPWLHLASREPLPPGVRRRAYVWEIASSRGVPAIAANWWAGGVAESPLLTSIGQNEIFTRATERETTVAARRVDELALAALEHREAARLATVYLPGLDILQRSSGAHARDRSLILDAIARAATELLASGWEVVLVGTPSSPNAPATILTSLEGTPESLSDVAPTLLDALGFPRSSEMSGTSWISSGQYEIASYGERRPEPTQPPDDEYYESLRSLGYVN